MDSPSSDQPDYNGDHSSKSRSVRKRRHRRGCCGCNCQIFCSYILAMISTSLVVGGVYLSLLYWDRIWLILSAAGFVLVLFGSCMYYCGVKTLYKYDCEEDDVPNQRRRRRTRRGNYRDCGSSGELVAASDSQSQLSLNMIPQYFNPRNDSVNQSAPNQTAFSQIMNLNGQSFLVMPLNPTEPESDQVSEQTNIPLDNDSETVEALQPDIFRKPGDSALNDEEVDQMTVDVSNYFSHLRVRSESNSSKPADSETNSTPAVPANKNRRSRQSTRNARQSSREPAPCTSVDTNSYFVSFDQPRQSGSRDSQRSAQNVPQVIGATVRTPLQRHRTFRQNKSTVIQLMPSSSSSDGQREPSPSTSTTTAEGSSTNCDNSSPALNNNSSQALLSFQPSNGSGDELPVFTPSADDDDRHELYIGGSETPPPSYAEACKTVQVYRTRLRDKKGCGFLFYFL
ncbi:hypothetical protein HDE_07388 [Halotydeus destructor]|nr:hypothetical protein HDE_07388 [Halotydeus destructor]